MAAEDHGAVATLLSNERPVRAAEVVGALSLATDLGTGQPLEHALRTAVLSVRLGELAGASARELAETYYVDEQLPPSYAFAARPALEALEAELPPDQLVAARDAAAAASLDDLVTRTLEPVCVAPALRGAGGEVHT